MNTNKFDFRNLAVSAWDTVGDKAVSASLGLATKQLSKEMIERYHIEQNQILSVSNELSELISFLINAKVHNQNIESSAVANILTTGLIPSVASIARNNPKGNEVVTIISTYISNFSNNEIIKSLLKKFSCEDITEYLQNAANAIKAIEDNSEITGNNETEEKTIQKSSSSKEEN